MKKVLLGVMVLAVMLNSCYEPIKITITTKINEDSSCRRQIEYITEKKPSPVDKEQDKIADENSLVKLEEEFIFPDKEKYKKWEKSDYRFQAEGEFLSPNEIPVDYQKKIADSDKTSKNTVRFKETNCVILTTYSYEERITDIVVKEEFDQALDELLILFKEMFYYIAEKRYGQDYDLSKIKAYFEEEIIPVFDDIVQIVWESYRMGTHKEFEESRMGEKESRYTNETGLRILSKLKKIGLEISMYQDDDDQNEKILSEFVNSKLGELLVTKRQDIERLTIEKITIEENEEKLEELWQEFCISKFGSEEEFEAYIHERLPKIFGAYYDHITCTDVPYHFNATVEMPGIVINTNGILLDKNRTSWKYFKDDLIIKGCTMKAKSILVNKETSKLLGGTDLNKSVRDMLRIEKSFSSLGEENLKSLQHIMRKCLEAQSLLPLEEVAFRKEAGEGTSCLKARAKELVDILTK